MPWPWIDITLRSKEKGFLLFGNKHSPIAVILLYNPSKVLRVVERFVKEGENNTSNKSWKSLVLLQPKHCNYSWRKGLTIAYVFQKPIELEFQMSAKN